VPAESDEVAAAVAGSVAAAAAAAAESVAARTACPVHDMQPDWR